MLNVFTTQELTAKIRYSTSKLFCARFFKIELERTPTHNIEEQNRILSQIQAVEIEILSLLKRDQDQVSLCFEIIFANLINEHFRLCFSHI